MQLFIHQKKIQSVSDMKRATLKGGTSYKSRSWGRLDHKLRRSRNGFLKSFGMEIQLQLECVHIRLWNSSSDNSNSPRNPDSFVDWTSRISLDFDSTLFVTMPPRTGFSDAKTTACRAASLSIHSLRSPSFASLRLVSVPNRAWFRIAAISDCPSL